MVEAHSRRGRSDEDAPAGPRSGLDEAPHLEEADCFIDGGDGDARAPADLLLGADTLSGGHGRVDYLTLQVSR